MLSPEYQAVARWLALDKVNDHSAISPRDSGLGAWSGWSATRRRVAVCCGLHGRSLREAASDLGVSLHTVRRHWDAVKALVDAAMPPRARRGEHAE